MSSYSDIDITSDSSRNYTLELQGLSSIVTCAYVIESVINVTIPLPNVWQTNGTCATPEQNIFADNTTFISLPSNNYLAFWACQTAQSGDSYNLYLRGVGAYFAPEIGNITCIISPIQPAVFEVNYSGQVLTVAQEYISKSPMIHTDLIRGAVEALGDIVWQVQTLAGNSVADLVLDSATRDCGIAPANRSEEVLKLFEAVIQGMLEYDVCLITANITPLMNFLRQPTPASFTRQKSLNKHHSRVCVRSMASQMSESWACKSPPKVLYFWSQ